MQESRSEGLGSRSPLPRGTRIDHYVIDRVLGAGGFGITYLAVHPRLEKHYAIKEYFPESFSRRDGDTVLPTASNGQIYRRGLDSFTNEARALAQFKHPSILDVTGIFEENGTAYIVLAFEKGVDLGSWLKRLGRPPTQAELDRLLEPLLSALETVHRRNLLHRDLSPDNILVRDDGSPVLIDFGAAREAIRDRPNVMSAIVKHGYSPPEQYSTQPGIQGPWTDIYGLAATLYLLITGKKPPEAMNRMMNDDMASLAAWSKSGYRQSFLQAIEAGLRLRPEQRPQNIAIWREAMFLDSARPLASESSPLSPSRWVAARKRGAVNRSAYRRSTSQSGSRSDPSAETGRSRDVPQRASRFTETGRPDIRVLEELEADRLANAEPAGEGPAESSLRGTLWAVGGALAGATAGLLGAVFLASIFASRCSGDGCLMSYLLPCIGLGALLGLFAGIRLAGRTVSLSDSPRDAGGI